MNRYIFKYLFILYYSQLFILDFICIIDKEDNELLTLEIIHHYVELLDKYFGNVCELDIIFNFHKVIKIIFKYFIYKIIKLKTL